MKNNGEEMNTNKKTVGITLDVRIILAVLWVAGMPYRHDSLGFYKNTIKQFLNKLPSLK
jgi:hypothetical protein